MGGCLLFVSLRERRTDLSEPTIRFVGGEPTKLDVNYLLRKCGQRAGSA